MNVQLIQSKEIDFVTNKSFQEVEDEIQYILTTIKEIYNYTLMPEELAYTQLPFISTRGKTLGQSTIFNAVFADTEL